jgi:Transposase domain (DUF772)
VRGAGSNPRPYRDRCVGYSLAPLATSNVPAVEYQIRDRLSFMRFLGLGLEDVVPDATTVWLFREALSKANLVKALFERFNGYLNTRGYIARGGQIPDQVRDRRQHCRRAQAAQQPRRERGDQGRQDARGLGGRASQECAEGQTLNGMGTSVLTVVTAP